MLINEQLQTKYSGWMECSVENMQMTGGVLEEWGGAGSDSATRANSDES